MENDNEFRGFCLFNDVENVEVRAWNRMMMYFNIFQDHGRELADEYVEQLDDIARKHMQRVQEEIKKVGYAQVRQKIQEAV